MSRLKVVVGVGVVGGGILTHFLSEDGHIVGGPGRKAAKEAGGLVPATLGGPIQAPRLTANRQKTSVHETPFTCRAAAACCCFYGDASNLVPFDVSSLMSPLPASVAAEELKGGGH